MKTCPTCGAEYSSSELYCIEDGSVLVDADDTLGFETDSPPAARSGLSKETIVGLALAALVLLVISGVFVAQKSRQFRLIVAFDKGQNIQPGDNVFVQGHRVGSVESTRFESDIFHVTIAVRPDARPYMRGDSLFYVGFDQVLTNKRCIAVATSNDPSSPLLENGQIVEGHSWFGRIPLWAKQQVGKFLKPKVSE